MYLSGIAILIGLIAIGSAHPVLAVGIALGLAVLWNTC